MLIFTIIAECMAQLIIKHQIRDGENLKKTEITKFVESGEAESGNAGDQPARNNLTSGDNQEGENKSAPSTADNELSLLYITEKTQKQNHILNSNIFEKSVQSIGD